LWCPGANPGECAGLEISSRSFKGDELEKGGTGLMKGKCPKCGAIYYGWALGNPLYQKCERCGNNLEISTIEKCTDTYQPVFSYPEYKIIRDRMKEAMTIN
jgi:hypothetical protein